MALFGMTGRKAESVTDMLYFFYRSARSVSCVRAVGVSENRIGDAGGFDRGPHCMHAHNRGSVQNRGNQRSQACILALGGGCVLPIVERRQRVTQK